MKCRICQEISEHKFTAKVLSKYDVKYFYCTNCEYLFTENPYWLNEAYASAINITDTGLMERNLNFSKIISVLFYFFFDKKAKFLDYAGGYGIFTRLMRDVGFDFYWDDKHCENLLARGFELNKSSLKKAEAVTALEVFEHLEDPVNEIKNLLDVTDTIIFSTLLLPDNLPNPGEWWYYAFDHGQHISFYSSKTLKKLADMFNLKTYSFGSLHILTRRNIKYYIARLILKLSKSGLFFYVKKKMKSKTWDDHLSLSNNVK